MSSLVNLDPLLCGNYLAVRNQECRLTFPSIWLLVIVINITFLMTCCKFKRNLKYLKKGEALTIDFIELSNLDLFIYFLLHDIKYDIVALNL